jgi:peptide methionine sulfoxide reductase msrA/msrB
LPVITPLKNYASAENYHQDYLEKNPLRYCGLGGTGVACLDPDQPTNGDNAHATRLDQKNQLPEQNWQLFKLDTQQQLIAFEAEECSYCRQFDKNVLSTWNDPTPIVSANLTTPLDGWTLKQALLPRQLSCCSKTSKKLPATPVIKELRNFGNGCVNTRHKQDEFQRNLTIS